ncbi:hypothetical protein [Celeribacter persicus]|uniref:Uncharacterized protein n=1 Tax=Celeribacter persicus TaxID=1651082 RepID=A0A2T5HW73_9RHOB|nr:hypothetical protein [Celeribacter persicus]PTQ75795.1 hypothetical protein C8N42_101336 [Celeribacter persicus]
MKNLLSKLHHIRWKSELYILRFSRKLWLLAPMPIFLMIFFWVFVYALPILPLSIFTIVIMENDPQPALWVIFANATIQLLIGLPATIIGFVYSVKWYIVAASLMFGKTQIADRKEAFLREKLSLIPTTAIPQSPAHRA